jgi:hypothetical protein
MQEFMIEAVRMMRGAQSMAAVAKNAEHQSEDAAQLGEGR